MAFVELLRCRVMRTIAQYSNTRIRKLPVLSNCVDILNLLSCLPYIIKPLVAMSLSRFISSLFFDYALDRKCKEQRDNNPRASNCQSFKLVFQSVKSRKIKFNK